MRLKTNRIRGGIIGAGKDVSMIELDSSSEDHMIQDWDIRRIDVLRLEPNRK